LELRTLDGTVIVHQHDYGLQEKRIASAAGVAPSDGGQQ
jgi:hypothetical protein